MAKEKSEEIVSEEADYKRRFETLEANAAESKGLLEKISKKLGLDEEPKPDPKPEPKGKNEPKPATKPGSGFKGFFQELGILAKE